MINMQYAAGIMGKEWKAHVPQIFFFYLHARGAQKYLYLYLKEELC